MLVVEHGTMMCNQLTLDPELGPNLSSSLCHTGSSACAARTAAHDPDLPAGPTEFRAHPQTLPGASANSYCSLPGSSYSAR